MDKLFREATAAQILDLQPRTLSRCRFTGTGPAYHKVGGAVRYRAVDLEKFVADGRVAAND